MNHRRALFSSVALGIVLMGAWLSIIDLRNVIDIAMQMKTAFIIPLVICFAAAYFLRTLRWKIVLSPVERITIAESFHLCMTNYLINFLIPVHAGEVAKSLLLKKMKGTPVSQSLLTVYVDKIMDLLPFFLLLALTPFLGTQIDFLIYMASGILLLILVLLILLLAFLAYRRELALRWSDAILSFLPRKLQQKAGHFLNLFAEAIVSLRLLSGRFIEIAGLTLAALIIHCVFMWLFFYSFGIDLPVLTVFVGYLLLNAAFILPAPPGFAGTLELSFVFIFTYLYGYDKNVVSAIAASSHLFIAILFGLFGFVSITLIGTKLSTVLKLESANDLGTQEVKVHD